MRWSRRRELDVVGDALFRQPLEGGDDEVDPGLEVVEQGALGHSGTSTDRGGCGAVVAELGDRRDRGVDERVDGVRPTLGLRAPRPAETTIGGLIRSRATTGPARTDQMAAADGELVGVGADVELPRGTEIVHPVARDDAAGGDHDTSIRRVDHFEFRSRARATCD